MKMSDTEGLGKKITKFFMTNAWITTIMIVFTFVYLNIKIGNLFKKNEQTLNYVKADLGKVIFVSSTGNIVKMKKESLFYSDKRVALYIKNLIQEHLIQDLASISKGFSVNYISYKDMVNNYQPFKTFLPYLTNKNILYNYANNIFELINEDEYPEYLHVYDCQINSYDTDKKGDFTLKLTYFVIMRAYYKELTTASKWRSKKVTMNVTLKGYFDVIHHGSINNPFGIVFTEIKIPLVTKR